MLKTWFESLLSQRSRSTNDQNHLSSLEKAKRVKDLADHDYQLFDSFNNILQSQLEPLRPFPCLLSSHQILHYKMNNGLGGSTNVLFGRSTILPGEEFTWPNFFGPEVFLGYCIFKALQVCNLYFKLFARRKALSVVGSSSFCRCQVSSMHIA